jgi:hypothetical protein
MVYRGGGHTESTYSAYSTKGVEEEEEEEEEEAEEEAVVVVVYSVWRMVHGVYRLVYGTPHAIQPAPCIQYKGCGGGGGVYCMVPSVAIYPDPYIHSLVAAFFYAWNPTPPPGAYKQFSSDGNLLRCPIMGMVKNHKRVSADIQLPMPYTGCRCVKESFGTSKKCWSCTDYDPHGLSCVEERIRIARGLWIFPFWKEPDMHQHSPEPPLVRCPINQCCDSASNGWCDIDPIKPNQSKSARSARGEQGILCADGRDSSALLCSKCSDELSATFGSASCVHCTRREASKALAFMGVLALLFVACLLQAPKNPKTRGSFLISTYFFQTVTILLINPDSSSSELMSLVLGILNVSMTPTSANHQFI